MALKTLDAAVKQEFTNAGVTLTPHQEHVAASTTIDWVSLLKTLGNIAATIIPIIIGLLGGNAPAPAQASPGCCDHHKCCSDALKAILKAAEIEAAHMCECCC